MLGKREREQVIADRKLLERLFPHCFCMVAPNVKKPLKVGIHHDLAALRLTDHDGKPIGKYRIRLAMRSYCTGPKYARGLVMWPWRVDLDGKDAGYVTDVERAHAWRHLLNMPEKWRVGIDAPDIEIKEAA